MNICAVTGRLTDNAVVRKVNEERAVISFTIAVDKGLNKEMKENFARDGKPTADFFNVVSWYNSIEAAHNFAQYLTKGVLVGLSGSMQQNVYKKDNETVYSFQIVTRNIDLLSYPNNGQRQQPQQQRQQQQQPQQQQQQQQNNDFESTIDDFTGGFMPDDADIPF